MNKNKWRNIKKVRYNLITPEGGHLFYYVCDGLLLKVSIQDKFL